MSSSFHSFFFISSSILLLYETFFNTASIYGPEINPSDEYA